MTERNFFNMDHLQIKSILSAAVAKCKLWEIVRSVRAGLLYVTSTELPYRGAFSRAIRELFHQYMKNNATANIRLLLGSIDTSELDSDTLVRQTTLAKHRSVVCRSFAQAINDAASSKELEESLAVSLGDTLVALMKNLSRVHHDEWMTQIEEDCRLAFERLNYGPPDDAYRVFQPGPSGKHPDRPPHKAPKRKRSCQLEAQRAEPQPGRARPRYEDHVSSGSGSDTNPKLKKGSANPYIGAISFPAVVKDSPIHDVAGSSRQSGASGSNTRKEDATKSMPSGLRKPRDSERPSEQGRTSGSKDKDSKEPSGQEQDSDRSD